MTAVVRPRGSVRAMLHDQHLLLESLLTEAVEAAEAGVDARTFGALWSRFGRFLRQHLATEEAVLFPRLSTRHGPEIRHLQAEHERLRAWLDEVALEVDLHLARATTIGALVEALRAHAREEDEGLYLWAEQELDAAEVAEHLDLQIRAA